MNKNAFVTILLFVTTLAILSQPIGATTITSDAALQTRNMQLFDALRFLAVPGAPAAPSVPESFTAIEQVMTFNDQPTTSAQADLHFTGASMDLSIQTATAGRFSPDLSSNPGVQAIQTFTVAQLPTSNWMGSSEARQDLASAFRFNFATDSSTLFNKTPIMPAEFFQPAVDSPPSFLGGVSGFDVVVDGPEPASFVLFGAGFGAVALMLRRKKKISAV